MELSWWFDSDLAIWRSISSNADNTSFIQLEMKKENEQKSWCIPHKIQWKSAENDRTLTIELISLQTSVRCNIHCDTYHFPRLLALNVSFHSWRGFAWNERRLHVWEIRIAKQWSYTATFTYPKPPPIITTSLRPVDATRWYASKICFVSTEHPKSLSPKVKRCLSWGVRSKSKLGS